MKFANKDDLLTVSELVELTAAKAPEIKNQIRTAFVEGLVCIDFDCSSIHFIDSSGLGLLISLQKLTNERSGKFRLLYPKSSVVQLLELTRLHRVFEIVL